MHTFIELGIISIAVAGFFLAFYIARKKNAPQPLVCPMKSNCSAVITSDYSRFLGIPVERLGMAYYAFIALVHGFFLMYPAFLSEGLSFFVTLATAGAFLFSLYLVSIQAFALKQWCTWCLLSALFCFAIFVFTMLSMPIDLTGILVENRNIVILLHLFGVSLGVGTATITDIFFMKFLKDFRISEGEAKTLKTFSQIIWFGLGILVLSGVGLVIPAGDTLFASSKFLVKMIGVGVLIANGILLNITIAPRLVDIAFKRSEEGNTNLDGLRKLAFASGGISISTWYFVFVMGALNRVSLSFEELLYIYIAIVLVAVIGSQIFAQMMYTKKG